MKTASSAGMIVVLRTLFSRFGIPRTLVSHNGPQFTSEAFDEFMNQNCILHLRSAPYHPQSNGLAERAVRIIKEGLRKNQKGTLSARLARILHRYRRTPLKCGWTPAMLLLGREIRSRLDNLVPRPDEPQSVVREKSVRSKFYIGNQSGCGTTV